MPCITVCNESESVPISIPHCIYPAWPPSSPPEDIISPEAMRKVWEGWDLRILILYILFTQIYLHVFGRRRRKSTPRMLNRLNVWLLYLFAEFLATIALGKLSDLKPPVSVLRGLWAPIILFYLGGPDTITVLHLEENHMWTRHLIGLFTQGVRTSYVLSATWSKSHITVLAMLMLFSGLIKYGERVWVIRSRVRGKSEVGLVWFDESKLLVTNSENNANLVVKAYSYFQILKPHLPFRDCDRSKLGELIKRFREELVGNRLINPESANKNIINAFELIEIELGFTYDVLFSKVETIFTVWGCILRFVSFSCVVYVLVGFLLLKKRGQLLVVDDPYSNILHDLLVVDVPITIIMLCGAIFLEIAGVFVQLVSDWAVVWAYNHPSKLVTPIFHLHKLVASKTRRWSEKMSQINLLNICRSTKLEELEEALYRREKMMKFSSLTPIPSRLQELIIGQLLETISLPPAAADDDSSLISSSEVDSTLVQNSTNMRRGSVWTLEKYNEFLRSLNIIDLEFQESIVVWHIATDICYHLHDKKKPVTDEMNATKILSDYMMHLLFTCRLPICSASNKYMQTCVDVKKILPESIKSPTEACSRLLRETECDSSNVTAVNNIQKLVTSLMENVENKWKIINDVWVEMLCYAASCCPATNHIDGLRYGGEFLTHVWLLLMHFGLTSKKNFGVTKKLEENNAPQNSEKQNEKGDGSNILTQCLEGLCV